MTARGRGGLGHQRVTIVGRTWAELPTGRQEQGVDALSACAPRARMRQSSPLEVSPNPQWIQMLTDTLLRRRL